MKILLIDNYDSFTFNLVHYIESFNSNVTIVRNDELILEEINNFDKIVLSPGPGLPEESGLLMKAINYSKDKKPILGVCLGMQAIATHFKDELYNLKHVCHGVQTELNVIEESIIFEDIPKKISVGLYHSWAVKLKSTSELKALAYSKDNVLMALEHKKLPIYGVQFHPESILTDFGKKMIENFLKID